MAGGAGTELEQLINYYITGIGIPLLDLYGIIVNILCIFVLCRSEILFNSPPSILLIGLSISDIIYLIGETIVYLPNWLILFGYPDLLTLRDIDIIKIPLHVLESDQIASIYFTLAINWNRYIAVCNPFHVKIICSKSRLFGISAFIFLLAFLLQLPILLDGIILLLEGRDLMEENSVHYFGYYHTEMAHWGFPLIKFGIPFPCLVFFNVCIWLELRRASKYRSALRKGINTRIQADMARTATMDLSDDRAITKMLLTVVAVFGICYTPLITLIILNRFIEVDKVFGLIPGTIAYFLIPFNCSSNILVYFFMGKQFRASLFTMCFGKYSRNNTKNKY